MHFDFDDLLVRLARRLDSASIPYMVIGGQAVIRHGEPRFTRDIDLTLGIPPTELDQLLTLLPELQLTPRPENPREFALMTHVLPCQATDSPLRVDFSFTDSPYELAAIARGEDVFLQEIPVRFTSAEDLIIHKVIAGRPIDLQDIHTILLKNAHLETPYIRHWLSSFSEALEKPLLDQFDALDRKLRR